ncbi:MAG: hypothetical protein EOS85_31950 [Mesorhizobium sp.]|nr:MAG: hypothetical protein EOS85_31950 [Mesorhizobium sp.]
MPGRAEGGAVPPAFNQLQPRAQADSGWEKLKVESWRSFTPPLSCRTPPPQGGRSDAASAFANHQR